eukprot:jgi/Chlat1/807/Chrsp104S01256
MALLVRGAGRLAAGRSEVALLGKGARRWASASSSSSVEEADRQAAKTAEERREVGTVSGVPQEHLRRKVLVYSPARTAMQQGVSKTHSWRMEFDSTQKWENPLMGWTSSADPLSTVGQSHMRFDTAEEAVQFAAKHGWEVELRHPQEMLRKTKAYANNFKWKGAVPESAEEEQ